MSLLSRLRERKMVQWSIGYLAGAWLAVQVLGFLAGTFDWPFWIVRVATVALGCGAVAVLVLAWFHGEHGQQRVTPLELAILLVLAALAGLGSWSVVRRAEATSSPQATRADPDVRAIAVLPFANTSGDPANEYFSDGITEELLNALAQVPGLRVAARTSSFAFKGKNVPVDSVARELKVRAVLEGSVRKAGDRVRIAAELVDASNGYHMGAWEFDRELKDVFAIQEEIARSIADTLKVALAAGTRARLARAATISPEAHTAYLQGRFFFNKRSPAGLERAVAYFQQAIRLDAHYAAAWSGLADAWSIQADFKYVPLTAGLAQAERAADRALALDPASAEAHSSRGYVLELRREWEGAETEYRRAIELRPDYATAHQWYAVLLATQGRDDEALRQARTAFAADPLSAPVGNILGLILLNSGQSAAAADQFRRTLEIDPDFGGAQTNLGRALAALGRYDAAVDRLQKAVAARPDRANPVSALAYVYVREGKAAEARQILRQVAADPRLGPPERTLALARIYATLGQRDSAFHYLYQMEWTTEAVHGLRVDERLAPLRPDPRFAALMNTLGLN